MNRDLFSDQDGRLSARVERLSGDALIRSEVSGIPVPNFTSPAFVEPPPLSEAVIAIVTTAGIHHVTDPGWNPGAAPALSRDALTHTSPHWRADESFCVLERTRRDYQLAHWSPNFDRTGFAADHNVVFPIDRLEDMATEGRIKGVSPIHIAFVGAQNSTMSTIRYDSGPAAAAMLRGVGVNLVLLTPV